MKHGGIVEKIDVKTLEEALRDLGNKKIQDPPPYVLAPWLPVGPTETVGNYCKPWNYGYYEELGIPKCLDREVMQSEKRNRALTDEFVDFLEHWIACKSKSGEITPWSRVKYNKVRPILSVFADWLAGRYRG